MTDTDLVFQNHLEDLAKAADRRGLPVFTDFLDLNQQNIFLKCRSRLPVAGTGLYGGYEQAERQMLAFYPDALSFVPADFPIACMKLSIRNRRFAQPLTHRDYLGTMMSLGIDRGIIGDILPTEEGAFFFCRENMASFLTQELRQVRHTAVLCERTDRKDFNWVPNVKKIRGTVPSVRLDALLSLAFGDSRSSLTGLIKGGKVFVNAREITSPGFSPAEGDLISVRQKGKFRYLGVISESRKGRLFAEVELYC